MPFPMTVLNRSKSETYTARESIPKNVQAEYEQLYGQRWEAKLRLPKTLRQQEAKARYEEWVAEIEAHIVDQYWTFLNPWGWPS